MAFPPDIAFVIQIVLFVGLWVILKHWLFDPVMRVLELRRDQTSGRLAEAQRLNDEATQMQEEYARRLEEARVAAREEVAALRAEAEREEARILEAARAESARVIDQTRDAVGKELEAARANIVRYAAELSVEAAEKILGRRVQ